jgi:hypothetical protein
MTAARFSLRAKTMYTVRYSDLEGRHHEMTATYLGTHKFGGTTWTFRPLLGVKNLRPGAIVSALVQVPGTHPSQPHRLPREGQPEAGVEGDRVV